MTSNDLTIHGYPATEQRQEIERLRAALHEIVRREARSEYSSIYAAPAEFANIARKALGLRHG